MRRPCSMQHSRRARGPFPASDRFHKHQKGIHMTDQTTTSLRAETASALEQAREAAGRALDTTAALARQALGQTGQAARELREEVGGAAAASRRQLGQYARATRRHVAEQPVRSAVIAAAVGAAVMALTLVLLRKRQD